MNKSRQLSVLISFNGSRQRKRKRQPISSATTAAAAQAKYKNMAGADDVRVYMPGGQHEIQVDEHTTVFI